jgi:hypothetical protein
MIDSHVQQLITHAIDSTTKLHLLLVFHEHSGLHVTPAQMAERVCRDIWSVTQGLDELARDGILQVHGTNGDLSYCYMPRLEYIEPIQRLIHRYNDPAERSDLRRSIHELAGRASLRRAANQELL